MKLSGKQSHLLKKNTKIKALHWTYLVKLLGLAYTVKAVYIKPPWDELLC